LAHVIRHGNITCFIEEHYSGEGRFVWELDRSRRSDVSFKNITRKWLHYNLGEVLLKISKCTAHNLPYMLNIPALSWQ
jgi:hypothetical protein